MKITLGDVQSSVASGIVRLKRWLDPPLTADAQPLEIRESIVDAIEQRAVPAGGGQRVLAHNQISVTVLVSTQDERLTMRAVLADLQDAVVSRLREIRCQIPAGFALVVHYTRRPRPGWTPGQRLAVEYGSRDIAISPDAPRTGPPSLRVTVLRGHAMQAAYTLTESVVHIGRTALPVDSGGRPRQNHVAFIEDGDEHSHSVGRAHASIRFEPVRGEYRLFDDGSRNGTRLVRNGTTFEIRRQDPTGVTLVSGDELHLGTAAIRIDIENRV